MKIRLLCLLLFVLTAGCATYRGPLTGHVFSGAYQGEGLYVDRQDMTVTNGTDELDIFIPVFNGYRTPVFLNVERYEMFGNPAAPDVECYDRQGNRIMSGSLGKKVSYGCGGHAQDFVRIPAGHIRNGKLERMCTNTTSIRYRVALNKVVPDDEWLTPIETHTNEQGSVGYTFDITPVPLPPATSKMVLKVPVCFDYILGGETRRRSCDIHITVTVYRNTEDNLRLMDCSHLK